MTAKSATRFLAAVAAVASLSLVLVGCDAGTTPSSAPTAAELPAEIHVVSIKDRTGAASFAGLETNRGIAMAVDEINDSGMFPNSKIVVDYKDPATDANTASQLVTAAIADPSIVAIFGPVLGTESVVVSPRAQAAKMPIIFSQSSVTGTLTGDYTFRITPPPVAYNKVLFQYLAKQGVKNFSILYASDSAGTVEYAEKIWPDLAKDEKITVKNAVGVPTATQDYSAPISQLLADNPDAVGLDVLGAGFVTAVKLLRQNGYKGKIFATSVIDNFMKDIGTDGKGIVWPTPWTSLSTADNSVKFVDAFGKKYNGDVPLSFAVDGYDSVYWLAKAIEASGSATRDGIQQGLTKVAKDGFSGAQGDYTFEDGDARLAGYLLSWNGTERELASK